MSRHFVRTLAMTGLISVGLTFGAAAQTPVQPQPKDPNMPAPHNTVPDKIEGRPSDTTGATGTLSDKLQKSDGVITPPASGAAGRTITPPDTGTMPIVPPAGSPGSRAPNADPR